MINDSYAHIIISKSFYKVDENMKILGNQSFVITSVDGDVKIDGLNFITLYDGMYNIADSMDTNYANMKTILPKVLVERLDNLKTKDDVISLGEEMGVDYYEDEINLTMPVKIKQATTQEGYITNDLVYLLDGSIYFDYDASNNIISSSIHLDGCNDYNMIRYEDFEGINNISDFSKYDYGSIFNINGDSTCINQSNADGKIITDTLNNPCENSIREYGSSWSYDLVHYFVDYKGEAKLEINSTVNNVSEYNAKNNKELSYKIIVENKGEISSWNNVIVTYVPKEIVIDKDSISNNGEYDKNDNSITWKIEELGAGENIVFSYDAVVSLTADKSKSYVGKTKAFSNQVETFYAKDTKVFLTKSTELVDGSNNLKNPDTYSTAVFGIVTVILVILVISVYFIKKKESTN